MIISPLPYPFIENDFLRVDYLTPTGPPIGGLSAVETARRISKQLSLK
jgi:hypothetical protein